MKQLPQMEQLIDWLPANVPEPFPTTVAHGDYRIDNLIFHPTENRVLAVLDWELSTLGDPMADLAYSAIPYYLPKELPQLSGFASKDGKYVFAVACGSTLNPKGGFRSFSANIGPTGMILSVMALL